MSSYTPPEDPGDKDKYLTQPEREQLQRLLSQPEEFPRELGSWVTDYVGTNAFIQKSQVQGLPLLNTQVQTALDDIETLVDQVAASQVTADQGTDNSEAATSATSPYNIGPNLLLSAGTYLILFGYECRNDSGLVSYTALYSWNTASFLPPTISLPLNQGTYLPQSSFTLVSLSSQGYVGLHGWSDGGFGWWKNRNIVALRIGA